MIRDKPFKLLDIKLNSGGPQPVVAISINMWGWGTSDGRAGSVTRALKDWAAHPQCLWHLISEHGENPDSPNSLQASAAQTSRGTISPQLPGSSGHRTVWEPGQPNTAVWGPCILFLFLLLLGRRQTPGLEWLGQWLPIRDAL